MNVSDAVRSGIGVLLTRPGSVLPLYLFEASALLIVRVPLFVGAVIVFFVLVSQGRIAPVVREFQQLDLDRLSSANPRAFQGLADALAGLVTPTTIALTVITLLCMLVVWLVVRSVAAAGTVHAVYASLTGRDAVAAGIDGIARDTLRFIGLQVVRVGLVLIAGVPLGIVLVTTHGVALAFLAFAFVLVWIVLAIGIVIALLFAEQAIVVDDVGVVSAIRRSAGFVRHRLVAVLSYILIGIGVAIVVGIVFAVTAFLSVSPLAVLFSVLVVGPFLDLLKTGLYADDAVPTEPQNIQPVSRSVAAFRNDLMRVFGFLATHPIANVVSAGLLAASIAIGWVGVSGFNTDFSPTSDVGTVFGSFPVDLFVTIAANNWYVAANGIFAGLAFAVPTVVNLLFNGILVGVVGGLTAPVAFVALVLPHGIIELPALAVSGGVGLHLGWVAWGRLRGTRSSEDVGAELRMAYEVLLGLAPVFVLAAFIETFITPWIASIVLA